MDLLYRQDETREDHSLADAAVSMGRRLLFDEKHARQVASRSLTLFEAQGRHEDVAKARKVLAHFDARGV